MRLLLDENIPNNFGRRLKKAGYEVLSVNTDKLRGLDDKQILNFANKKKYTKKCDKIKNISRMPINLD